MSLVPAEAERNISTAAERISTGNLVKLKTCN